MPKTSISCQILLCSLRPCPSFCLSSILTTTGRVTAAFALPLALPALLQGRSSCQGSVTCCYQKGKLLLSFLPPPPSTHPMAGSWAEDTLLLGCAGGRQRRATRAWLVGSHLFLCLLNAHLVYSLLFLCMRSQMVTYNF